MEQYKVWCNNFVWSEQLSDLNKVGKHTGKFLASLLQPAEIQLKETFTIVKTNKEKKILCYRTLQENSF